ncbi:MAG: glycosyltransferase family 2 protein [Firmicutes bacterium]|nr:glycosyltransferase family 2 protein [Bacillota bacterium]
MKLWSPRVSIIVPLFNEERHVEDCLNSLCGQDYDPALLEIIAVDSRSTDLTAGLAHRLAEETGRITILTGKSRSTSSSLNLGMAAAGGEVVIIFSGHARAAADFVSRSVHWLGVTGADCVGGRLHHEGETRLAKLIAAALSSPFGVGDARFRVSARPGWVDTVAYGAYRRVVFERIGLFDEELVRNQDLELNTRLRRAGGTIYFTPEIRSWYTAPESLRRFCRQAAANGCWNILTLRKGRDTLRPRHYVPLLFVVSAGIFSLAGAAAGSLLPAAVPATLYGFAAFAASAREALVRRQPAAFLALPPLYLLLHLSYGLGSFYGILKAAGRQRANGRMTESKVRPTGAQTVMGKSAGGRPTGKRATGGRPAP